MNLDELFRESVARDPSHPVFVGAGVERPLTYSDLDGLVEHSASCLRRAGVQAGDCVGLHRRSGVDYVVLTYAVWRCGACVVPIPVELTPGEQARIPAEIHLSWLLTEDPTGSFAADYLRGEPVALESGCTLFGIESPREVPPGFADANAAFIRFTSGTTGDSKGVVLSHETIRDRIHAANAALGIGPQDRVVWLLSMSYHFAVSIVGYLTFGATIVLPRDLFGPAILEAVTEHRGTFSYGSPLHYEWMADAANGTRETTLRLAISTTTPLRGESSRAFEERFGLPLTQALGIIEVGLPCINVGFASSRPEAVGAVLPAYELRLRPTGSSGEQGEILLRGPGFLDAYYEPWRTREEITENGWFATGDVGELDGDGCLWIRGRSKDVINVAGMKFFPQEAEEVLRRCPGVAAARVHPFPHPRWGELPRADVILEPDAEHPPTNADLTAWCREHLAPFKIPVRFAFVEDFPRTASGKVLHRAEASAGAAR